MTFAINSVLGLVRSRRLALLLCAVAPVILTAAASASDAVCSLDSAKSAALLYLGSAENPYSVNVGVARVAGTVTLDTDHLDSSIVDLSIYPADEDWGRAINPDGDLAPGYLPDANDHILLTFRSKGIVQEADGHLQVIGDLTLTRVERSFTAQPAYGDPIMHMVTREITLVFPNPNAVGLGSQTSTALEKRGPVNISASARVSHEAFEELSGAILDTNWPPVVANEHCEVPPTVAEDYSGAKCTGTLIAKASYCHKTATVGKDYGAAICDPPAGEQTTIILQLKFGYANVRP